ncbi:MAG: ATP-binding protein [Acidobacteriia bacterium]|nr:ATP-binding protein [Terriglobia bacterium]
MMKSIRHNLRLRTKIIGLVTIVMISVLAISTYIGHFITQLLVEEDQYHRAVELAFANADRLAKRGVYLDPAMLAQEFQIIQRDHADVQGIALYRHGPGGAHILELAAPAGPPLLELDAQPKVQSMFEYYSPFEGVQSIETGRGKALAWIVGSEITVNGKSVACLNLKVSKSGINVISYELIKYNVLVLLVAILAIVILLSLSFHQLVNRPIERMLDAMRRAEEGALDTRVDVHREDELGTIALRFNHMMDRVKALNEALATRVAEATDKLQQRNVELLRINEELFETQRLLARSERFAIAGQLAAGLAHEIGTPLNAISGHVQLLAKAIPLQDEATRKRLKVIETQIENIVRVVKDLLASTRDTSLTRSATSLRQFLEEILLFAKPTLDMKHIHVHTEFDSKLPPIPLDTLRMQQVFLNLINNSIDAMPGGGTIRLRTRLRPPTHGADAVVIEFSDTGTGIAHEHLQRIFEASFTTKRIGSGAGLGLAISKQIIKAHGGDIVAERPEEGGARFIIELPLSATETIHANTVEYSRR